MAPAARGSIATVPVYYSVVQRARRAQCGRAGHDRHRSTQPYWVPGMYSTYRHIAQWAPHANLGFIILVGLTFIMGDIPISLVQIRCADVKRTMTKVLC